MDDKTNKGLSAKAGLLEGLLGGLLGAFVGYLTTKNRQELHDLLDFALDNLDKLKESASLLENKDGNLQEFFLNVLGILDKNQTKKDGE